MHGDGSVRYLFDGRRIALVRRKMSTVELNSVYVSVRTCEDLSISPSKTLINLPLRSLE